MTEQPWYESVVIPALLRHARSAYGGAMRKAQTAEGYDDIPGNGMWVIGALALAGVGLPIGSFVPDLRISKQAMGQLIDQLVLRGYIERTPDPEDRRQLLVTLTERGAAAAAVQAKARDAVATQLLARVGAETVGAMREGLATLAIIAREQAEG